MQNISMLVNMPLKIKPVGMLLAKAFKFMESYEQNIVVCHKLKDKFKSLDFKNYDMGPLKQQYSSEESIKALLENIAGKYRKLLSFPGYEQKLGLLQNYLVEWFVLFRKIKCVFSHHHTLIWTYLEDNFLLNDADFTTLLVQKSFFDYKSIMKDGPKGEIMANYVNEKIFGVTEKYLVNQELELTIMLLRGLLYHMKIDLTEDMIERVLFIIFELLPYSVKESKSNQRYRKNDISSGRLLSSLLFRKQNTPEQVSIILNRIQGFLQRAVMYFHQKSDMTRKKQKNITICSSFIDKYVKEMEKLKDTDPLRKACAESLNPVLKTILNFELLNSSNTGMVNIFYRLIRLEKEEFADYALQKLKYCFSVEEFRKNKPLEYLNNLAALVVKSEELCSIHLNWILSKLLGLLETSPDLIMKVFEIIKLYLEPFADLDKAQKTFGHLERYREDIDELGSRIIEFSFKKLDDNNILISLLMMLKNISEYLNDKLHQAILRSLRCDLISINLKCATNLIYLLSTISLSEYKAELKRIMLQTLLTKSDTPQPLESLTLGPILAKVGFKQMDYTLAINNEQSIIHVIQIISDFITTPDIPKETIDLFLIFLALAIEHEKDSVVDIACETLGQLRGGNHIDLLDFPTRAKFEEALASENSQAAIDSVFDWSFRFERHRDQSIEAVRDVFLETVALAEKFMREKFDEKTVFTENQLKPELLYKVTRNEPQERNKISRNSLKPLTSCIKIIAEFMKSDMLRLVIWSSSKLRSFLQNFKARLTHFAISTQAFFNQKFREVFLKLYSEILASIDSDFAEDALSKIKQFRKNKIEYAFSLDLYEFFSYISYFQRLYTTVHPDYVIDFDSLEIPPLAQTFLTEPIKTQDENLFIYGDGSINQFITINQRHETKLRDLLAMTGIPVKSGSMTSQFTFNMADDWYETELNMLLSRIRALPENTTDSEALNEVKNVGSEYSMVLRCCYRTTASLIDSSLDFFYEKCRRGDLCYQSILAIGAFSFLPASETHRLETAQHLEYICSKIGTEMSLTELYIVTMKVLVRIQSWTAKETALLIKTSILLLSSQNLSIEILGKNLLDLSKDFAESLENDQPFVYLDYHKFADEDGLISAKKTKGIWEELAKRVGLAEEGSGEKYTEDQLKEFDKFSRETVIHYETACPDQSAFFGAGNTVSQVKTINEFNKLLEADPSLRPKLENSFRTYILNRANTDWTAESKAGNDSTIKISQAIIGKRFWRRKDHLKTCREKYSARISPMAQAIKYLGIEQVEAVNTLLNEKASEKNKQFYLLKILLTAAGLWASSSWSDEEYENLLEFTGRIYKEHTNRVNDKDLCSFMAFAFIPSNMNFRRAKRFYEFTVQAMKEDKPENRYCYFDLLTYHSHYLCNLVIPSVEKALFEEYNKADLTDYETSVRLSMCMKVRNGAHFQQSRSWKTEKMFTFKTNCDDSLLLAVPEGSKLRKILMEFLEKAKGLSVVLRIAIVGILENFLTQKVTRKDFAEVFFSSLELLLTIDPNQDSSKSSEIEFLFNKAKNLRADNCTIKNFFTEMVSFFKKQLETQPNISGLQFLVSRLAVNWQYQIEGPLEELLFLLGSECRVELKVDTGRTIKNIFSQLPNSIVFGFAEKIYKKITKTVILKSKIKDKTDAEFKSLSKDLATYSNLLIGIITSRQWQINPLIEKCLQNLIKAKHSSTEASKAFDDFVTNFWSKQITNNFNDHELSEEIRDELNNFTNSYYYHS